jgi:hypothetical protein
MKPFDSPSMTYHSISQDTPDRQNYLASFSIAFGEYTSNGESKEQMIKFLGR